MAGTIYSFWRGRPTEAWYQLSQAERDSLLQKVGESQNESGGKTVLSCQSRWSGERWTSFGVSEYPSLEALQQDTARLEALDWYRYMETETMLGTPWQPNAAE
jgi:hypothetical protein